MAVDSERRHCTVTPRRQRREPPIFCMVTSYTLCAAVENIIRSMSHRHRDRGCGTYLFVTREGCVYLLLEDQSSAQRWLKDHFEELVGFYTQLPTRDFGLSIEANSMAEDIRDHMRGFGAWQ